MSDQLWDIIEAVVRGLEADAAPGGLDQIVLDVGPLVGG